MCRYLYVRTNWRSVLHIHAHTHTMDFPISRCLLVRASTLPPVGIILRPGSVETPFGKLNFGSMCGMFVYGCDLLALREAPARASLSRGSESQSDGDGKTGWQARAKFVDFEPSERGEFVDIYRYGI